MIIKMCDAVLLTKFGRFSEIIYYDGQSESVALVFGDVSGKLDVPCRIHSACLSAHVFNSIECDCREQMEYAQHLISENGYGLIVYLDQDGRGNGHVAKVVSEQLKSKGFSQSDAYEKMGYKADARDFIRAAEIITDLKISSIKLITNNPNKINDVTAFGVNVSGIIPAFVQPSNEAIISLYEDKIVNHGHTINTTESSK